MPKVKTQSQSDQVGSCTIFLGDCLKIMPTIAGSTIDLVLTDPPYGHRNNDGDLISVIEKVTPKARHYIPTNTEDAPLRPILNDGEEANTLYQAALLEFSRLLNKGGGVCCCCCGGGGPDPQFARWSLWLDKVLKFKQMVIWDKGPLGLGWHYHRSYECVLVATKSTSCNWYDKTCRVENIIRPMRYGVRKIIPRDNQHPTEKPVLLAEHFIELHTKPGDLVLDPFMGRGWAGVACIRTGRRFIGIELDPHWYTEAKVRLEKAVKVGVVPKQERGSAF